MIPVIPAGSAATEAGRAMGVQASRIAGEGRVGPEPGRRGPARGGRRAAWGARLERAARPVAHARLWRTLLRTAHLIAVAALYGGHVHGLPAERLTPALLATLATGGALAGLEIRHAPVWIAQGRGAATFAKLGLLAGVALWWEGRLLLLTAAMILGAVAAHMPGRYRYWSLLHGRVAGSQERG